MAISFARLQKFMETKGLAKTRLKYDKIVSGRTYDNLSIGMKEPIHDGVALASIDAICEALRCQPGDIMEWIPDDSEQG